MDLKLLNPEVQKFISKAIDDNLLKLALQKNPFPEIDWLTILQQIEAKKKSKDKLPHWFSTKNIIFPSKISIEQTSSEKTASYKSEIVSGNTLIDLTGGFGVDDFYFSKKMKRVIHCEIDSELSRIVKHNCAQLNIQNINCYSGDSLEILGKLNFRYDFIYIDPSRRNEAKTKVFKLQDCLPDVPKHLDYLLSFSNKILIKTAPLLDISAGLSELKNVKKIHIVAIENDVKELLWEIEKDYIGQIMIKTVNILKEKRDLFQFELYKNIELPEFGLPEKYLYEPNNALLKSGGFNEIGIFFNLKKLHKHSHLYTNTEISNFPGRIFEIENIVPYHKNSMKRFLEGQQANITIRNFPDTVEIIRKKWKIKDGGMQYCFFTTDANENKIVLICKKNK